MMSSLAIDLLKTILMLVAMSSNGAQDLARVVMTCKLFETAAKDMRVLKVINWSNVKVVQGRSHLFTHINGLLSQSAELGNETAQYLLSKAILFGSEPMWSRMLENDRVQANINNLSDHSPAAKKSMIDHLKEDAIIELPCISNVFYGNRHHTRLVRLFISRCSYEDLIKMFQILITYARFFKGSEDALVYGLIPSICHVSADAFALQREKETGRSISEDDPDYGSSESSSMLLSPQQIFELKRQKAIFDFDILFPPVQQLMISLSNVRL